ncbi:MAG: hypothetical protein OXG91_00640, partial [bacterium]|nr:hypothetical protein [bacterium]
GWGVFGGTGGNGAYTAMLVMGMITAALTAAYMTRCIYLTFFGSYRGHGHPHESGRRITVPLWILAVFAVGAGWTNLPKGFQIVPKSWTEQFGHYVEPPVSAHFYFPAIAHATPSWTLAAFSTLVVLVGAVASVAYYRRVDRRARAGGAATELVDGPTSRWTVARLGHTLLVQKYYLDHLYTGVVAKGTAGPVAQGAYWFNQHGIDEAVNQAGRKALAAGHVVYDKIDQKVIDGVVNTTGTASHGAGEELRRMQTGKVQQYAGVMFVASVILAAALILVL